MTQVTIVPGPEMDVLRAAYGPVSADRRPRPIGRSGPLHDEAWCPSGGRSPSGRPGTGTGPVVPAYYVVTDGKVVSVWDFQGAIAPDREVLRVSQAELRGSFDDLYSRLNPGAAAAAWQAKVSRLKEGR
jgi:hypothetical protein